MILAALGSPFTDSGRSACRECGSPSSDHDLYSGPIDTDHHVLFADSPISLLPEHHHLEVNVNSQHTGQSSNGVQTQDYSTFGFDQTHSQHNQFSQATTASSTAMKPSDIMHHWEPDLLLDSEMPPPLAAILPHDVYDTLHEELASVPPDDPSEVYSSNNEVAPKSAIINSNVTNEMAPGGDGENAASTAGADEPDEILLCVYGCGKEFSKPYLRNKHHKALQQPPHPALTAIDDSQCTPSAISKQNSSCQTFLRPDPRRLTLRCPVSVHITT